MRNYLPLVLASLTFAPLVTLPSVAQAGLKACGDIHVEAEAECEVKVEGGCTATCQPLAFEASCAAELHASCDGECNASADATCTATCDTTCLDSCSVDPGSFDCRGECNLDCQAGCDAECSASDNQGECTASCEATCSADCSARCDVVPPMATCDDQCGASCEGSCEAKAEINCQVDCQATGYAECKGSLQGGCEAECSKPEGALFCDGQYVDHGGNLEECVNALKEVLNIEVSGYAGGSCDNGTCEGEAGGAISCGSTVAPVNGFRGRTAALVGLLGLTLFGAGRRRR